jgi:hypothetical protein
MISTSLQYGTARMIHNIPLGSRVKTRISKEEYGERLQAEENGVNIESDDETDEEFDEVSEVCIPDDGDIEPDQTVYIHNKAQSRMKMKMIKMMRLRNKIV